MDYPNYSFAETLDSGFDDLDIESFLEESQERSRGLLEKEWKSVVPDDSVERVRNTLESIKASTYNERGAFL